MNIAAPRYIQDKYQESFQFLQARKKRQVAQLVLLNNLNRGDQNIASTLLITLFNRVMSSLYDDKIQVKFLPTQGILQEQLNSFNMLAQSDYNEMEMSKIDYDWCWDALFFGRGYVETLRFDKKKKIMQPHVINPLVFGYDPYFENPQQWRYYWKWITKSKWELEKFIKAGVIDGVKRIDDIPSGIDPYLWDYKAQRDKAAKTVEPSPDSMSNDVYQILEYFGYDDKGKKCVYWLDRDISQVLMKQELKLDDGEEVIAPDNQVIEMESKWPIVMKESFRIPHSSVPISIADLLEDKHRAKSVLLNLAYIASKDTANPLYGYNPDKVKDVSQFFSRQLNQHIPMEDESAAWPLAKAPAMTSDLNAFISLLTAEAELPVGAGQPMNTMGSNARQTATQASLDQQLNDMAQSLQSKVMQFGVSEFWSHWFHRYKANAEAIKEKMANIVGVKGISSTIIDMKDFNTDYPPGVMVYSAKEAEYKELVLRRDLMTLYPNLVQTLDPDGLRNFNKYVFFPKFLQDPSLIDIMLPKTLDEIHAEDENEMLAKDSMPPVAETDNHTTHIYTHYQVQPKTWATWMHIEWHQELLAKQKKQEMDMQQQQLQQVGAQGQPMSKPQIGAEKKNPLAQASPLKTETTNNLQANTMQ